MTILKILAKPKYLSVTIAVFLVVVVFAAWLPNLHLVTKTVASTSMSLWEKIGLLVSLIGSLQTNFTWLSRTLTIISAGLAGVQVSLLIYYLRQTARVSQSMGLSTAGVIASMLGIGCASCGSVILTTLLGLGFTTSVLVYLPLKGQEFGLLGVVLLLLAIHVTVKKINDPLACGIGTNNPRKRQDNEE